MKTFVIKGLDFVLAAAVLDNVIGVCMCVSRRRRRRTENHKVVWCQHYKTGSVSSLQSTLRSLPVLSDETFSLTRSVYCTLYIFSMTTQHRTRLIIHLYCYHASQLLRHFRVFCFLRHTIQFNVLCVNVSSLDVCCFD